jgi:hypothetical protein
LFDEWNIGSANALSERGCYMGVMRLTHEWLGFGAPLAEF